MWMRMGSPCFVVAPQRPKDRKSRSVPPAKIGVRLNFSNADLIYMPFMVRGRSQLRLLAALPRQAEKCRNLQNGIAAVVHLGFKAQLAAWADVNVAQAVEDEVGSAESALGARRFVDTGSSSGDSHRHHHKNSSSDPSQSDK
jgi:hypothetical protein